MKNLKKLVALAAVVGVIGTTGAVVYAATTRTPAEIAAGLTGKTVEEVYSERQAGKTFGTISNDAGKLEEFKTQMLEERKAILDERVKAGTLTQEQADTIYNTIKDNQVTCDATGSAGLGMRNGAGAVTGACGLGNGQGKGTGRGMMGGGFGGGMGTGRGMNK